jgi:hypothetical protein
MSLQGNASRCSPRAICWSAARLRPFRKKSAERSGICSGMVAVRNVEAQNAEAGADARAEALEAIIGVFST